MIAPKLVSHIRPTPEILYTHKPSPLKMALLIPCRFVSLTTPCVQARKPSCPTDHASWPVSRMLVMSPSMCGARSSSPGPVKVELASSAPEIIFLSPSFTVPLSVMVGDMAIMVPYL
jgi:hypothetical protein